MASPPATPRRYTAGEVSFCPAPAARVPDSAFAHEIYQRAGTDEKMDPARSELGASLRAAGHYVSWQAERRLTVRRLSTRSTSALTERRENAIQKAPHC